MYRFIYILQYIYTCIYIYIYIYTHILHINKEEMVLNLCMVAEISA